MKKHNLIKIPGLCCMMLLSVVSIFSFLGCYTPAPPKYFGFIRASGGKLVDENGLEYKIKGINTTDNWFDVFEEPQHRRSAYADMASYGMNTVRVCLTAKKFEKQVDGVWVLREDGIEQLKQSIENADAEGIRCIIDMHCPPECSVNAYDRNGEDPNNRSLLEKRDLQERFIAIWGFIAENFADNENVLGYGLVNEPIGPRNEKEVTDASLEWAVEQYESLLNETIAVIREFDKNHLLIMQRLCATYFIEEEGHLNTEVPIAWGGKVSEITQPLVEDPEKNVMIEAHWYKPLTSYSNGTDIVYRYGQTMVTPLLHTDNLTPYSNETEGAWTTWDWWGETGVRKNNVISRDEYNSLTAE